MASPGFEERVRDAGARADEPVTTDIKRLIRAPGSLHGGSGMRVVPLDIRTSPISTRSLTRWSSVSGRCGWT
ncbi:DNA primase small subunit domain-containing protein [Methanoculleus bourgensis]|uniref:Uncharacterized protein n=1 Tax=Methanoculleus bourgensis TaxID=83986 RepID=A0A0X3BMI0_9EURY|nr:protein of unknown function [Methanoculleus bourgensis]